MGNTKNVLQTGLTMVTKLYLIKLERDGVAIKGNVHEKTRKLSEGVHSVGSMTMLDASVHFAASKSS